MVKVVMFDLGQTLIDSNNHPFPHVVKALTAIAKQNLRTCLVSDFLMDLTTAQAMKQYLAVLDTAGLRQFFEPVAKRVTLSNHAGVTKPDPKIFKKALQRLGATAVPFADCLFITENASHSQAARNALKMQALQFGIDFTDWAKAPSMIAALSTADGAWVPISVPGHKDLADIHVSVPHGSPEHVEEARAFVRSLADNKQIEGRPGKPTFQATHAIETDDQGKRRLVRKRFSAF